MRQEPDHTSLYSQAKRRAQMCFLTPLNLPGDGLSGPGAGRCGDFIILLLLWVLMEKLCHQQQKKSGVSIVETFHEFQLRIISSYKKKKKSRGTGPCFPTTVFRMPFYQNAFLNMARWPVVCSVTLCKSITLHDPDSHRCRRSGGCLWGSSSWLELRFLCGTESRLACSSTQTSVCHW